MSWFFMHFKGYVVFYIMGYYLVQFLMAGLVHKDFCIFLRLFYIIFTILNKANLLLFLPALLYHWQDHLWGKNAIRTQICRVFFYPTTFVWLKVLPSCSPAVLSSPKVKAYKIQEAMKDQRKTWTQRTYTRPTKGPLITNIPLLIQVRRNNKSTLSVNLIWCGEEWMHSLK